MSKQIRRVKTVLTNAATWLTLASVFADEAYDVARDDLGLPETSVAVLTIGRVAAGLVASVLVIRRVSTVIPDDRGLLPLPNPPRLAAYPTEDQNDG